MRSAFIAAALAAVAAAVPLEKEKRDVVTATDREVVYVTQYYTVHGADEAEATPQAHYGGNDGHDNPDWWGGSKPNKGHQHTHKKPKPKPTTSDNDYPATWEQPSPTKAPKPPKPTKTHAPKPPRPSKTGGGGGGVPVGTVPNSYEGKVVYQHNIHRTNHSASHIKWDTALAATAQKIANSCVYAHNTDMDGGGYGQNIAAGVDPSGIDKVITNMFYNGEVNYYEGLYGEANPDMSNFEKWGHFSQIVWKSSSHVGCATQSCGSLANVGSNVSPYFTVCNYASPGNYAGEYGDNVGESLGHDTVTC